jgi:hypothetical protein
MKDSNPNVKGVAQRPRDDTELVDRVIEELRKAGSLVDPRLVEWHEGSPGPSQAHVKLPPCPPLPDYMRDMVARSIANVRGEFECPCPRLPPMAQIKKAARALVPFADMPGFSEAARRMSHLAQCTREPPDKADGAKYTQAAEMFFLLEYFLGSAKKITSTDGGPFREGAAILHEAVTGTPSSDVYMRGACELVLKERRKYPRGDPHDD